MCFGNLQGIRTAKFEERKDPHDASRTEKVFVGFEQLTPGTMKPQEYDDNIADLVSFMSWMAEPVQLERKRLACCSAVVLGTLHIIGMAFE
jgi:ubiquinol-cytochrome c reductase cytochrome c1 subunit